MQAEGRIEIVLWDGKRDLQTYWWPAVPAVGDTITVRLPPLSASQMYEVVERSWGAIVNGNAEPLPGKCAVYLTVKKVK